MADESTNFSNHLLIAMPNMDDPNFYQTVTYICEHNEYGALGIVINRPTTINLSEVFDQMEITSSHDQINLLPVLYGGPVHQERGFVIHRPFGKWRSSFETSDEISVTTSRDILEAIAEGRGPTDLIITLGYAGWGAGQLEEELQKNIWLCTPAQANILFDTPYENRWNAAAKLIGFDMNALSGDTGHA